MKIGKLQTKKFYSIGLGLNVVKNFTVVIFQFSQQAIVFVPCRPVQPSLMFVGKARSLPKSGAPDVGAAVAQWSSERIINEKNRKILGSIPAQGPIL